MINLAILVGWKRQPDPCLGLSSTTGSQIVFEEKINRIFQALEVHSDTELARSLGITPPSVASARQKKLIPIGWIEKISLSRGISFDWLYYGSGPMLLKDLSHSPVLPSQSHEIAPAISVKGNTCTPLDIRLEIWENERHELLAELRAINAENRELSAEIRKLWKENSDLRERCARLEERQACGNVG